MLREGITELTFRAQNVRAAARRIHQSSEVGKPVKRGAAVFVGGAVAGRPAGHDIHHRTAARWRPGTTPGTCAVLHVLTVSVYGAGYPSEVQGLEASQTTSGVPGWPSGQPGRQNDTAHRNHLSKGGDPVARHVTGMADGG